MLGFGIAVATIVSFVTNTYYTTKMSIHYNAFKEPFKLEFNKDIDHAKNNDEDTDKKNVKKKNSAPVSVSVSVSVSASSGGGV